MMCHTKYMSNRSLFIFQMMIMKFSSCDLDCVYSYIVSSSLNWTLACSPRRGEHVQKICSGQVLRTTICPSILVNSYPFLWTSGQFDHFSPKSSSCPQLLVISNVMAVKMKYILLQRIFFSNVLLPKVSTCIKKYIVIQNLEPHKVRPDFCTGDMPHITDVWSKS